MRSSAAIRLAFAMMELDELPINEDMDLTTLRVYVQHVLGPRTQDTVPDLYRHFDSPPALSLEP